MPTTHRWEGNLRQFSTDSPGTSECSWDGPNTGVAKGPSKPCASRSPVIRMHPPNSVSTASFETSTLGTMPSASNQVTNSTSRPSSESESGKNARTLWSDAYATDGALRRQQSTADTSSTLK